MYKIKNFEDLVKTYIGPNKIIIEQNFSSLMAPGENYFSDMQKICLVLKNKETGDTEELNLIAKCAIENAFGPTSELMQNEINFYNRIIPAFKKFQEKYGVPVSKFFPEFIGARINLTGKEKSDIDSVLILENLMEKGYKNIDRHIGFDLKEAKVVLKDLATFHSTFLALKLLEPETFKTEVKDHCRHFKPPLPKKDDKNGPPSGPPNCFPLIIDHLKTEEKFSQIIPAVEIASKRLKSLLSKPEQFFNKPAVEPFCTLCHNDMWVNNTMQKIQDGVTVNNKFVDFQMFQIRSLTSDLIFFLSSSVQSSVFRKEFDNLIQYYYEIFSDVLKIYGCYSPQFSYEKFLEELKVNIDDAIAQSIFMLPAIIFNEKGKEFDLENPKEMTLEVIPNMAKERIEILLVELAKRNWLA